MEYTLQQMVDIRQSVIDLADQVRALGDSISEIAQIRDKSNDALAQLQQVGIKLGIMEQTLTSLSISVSQVAGVAHTHSND